VIGVEPIGILRLETVPGIVSMRRVVALALLAACEAAFGQHTIYELEFPPEIFEHCVARHGTDDSDAADCMDAEKAKKRALDRALRSTGLSREMQDQLYETCRDLYPEQGIDPIRGCIKIKLYLIVESRSSRERAELFDGCVAEFYSRGLQWIEHCVRTEMTYRRTR